MERNAERDFDLSHPNFLPDTVKFFLLIFNLTAACTLRRFIAARNTIYTILICNLVLKLGSCSLILLLISLLFQYSLAGTESVQQLGFKFLVQASD